MVPRVRPPRRQRGATESASAEESCGAGAYWLGVEECVSVLKYTPCMLW